MTLIVCVLAHNYVALAADRRLTVTQGSNCKIVEDEECKIVLYNGYSIWAYTGPSKLAGRSTAEWLAIELANFEHNCFDRAISHIAQRLSVPIQNVPLIGSRLSIMAIGFVKLTNISYLVPAAARISNFEMPDGSIINPKSKFHVTRNFKDDNGLAFFTAGQRLNRRQLGRIIRATARPLVRGLHPSYAYPFFAQEFGRISLENIQVGDRVLVASLNRETAESAYSGKDYIHMLDRDFLYFGPSAREGIFHGPHSAQTGGSVLLNFRAGYL